jgi:hypothetical protein
MANPDGRAKLEASGNDCWRGNAAGVDFERNFEWEFAGAGSSSTRLSLDLITSDVRVQQQK